jgi:hypothetical protein
MKFLLFVLGLLLISTTLLDVVWNYALVGRGCRPNHRPHGVLDVVGLA